MIGATKAHGRMAVEIQALAEVTGFAPSSVQLAAAACAARLFLVVKIDRVVGRSTGHGSLLPVRDVISVLVFILSFFVSSVDWRGVRFAATPGGRLVNGQDQLQRRRP